MYFFVEEWNPPVQSRCVIEGVAEDDKLEVEITAATPMLYLPSSAFLLPLHEG
jgi:hypothetical protein